jgi:virulence factor Mce-like protein
LRAGLVTVVCLVALLLLALSINLSFGPPFNLSLSWPPGQDYTLKAAFADANGLARGASVQEAGHEVGQVTSIEVQGTRAVVSMRVERHYAPLRSGSIARIRYSTLLANKYVELEPSTSGKELDSGAILPTSETITPVDFDQFLSALDPQTRQRLQVVIQQLGAGLQDQHATVNDLLSQTSGLSHESRAPLSTFHAHEQDLGQIVTNLGIVSARLAQSHQQLGDLVASMNDVTGTLANNDTALASLILHLGNVMSEFDATLSGNEGNLRKTVTTLGPLLSQLEGTLSNTYQDTNANLAQLRANSNVLLAEVGSAVSTNDLGAPCNGPGGCQDGNGNVLREFLVLSQPCPKGASNCGGSQGSLGNLSIPIPSLPQLPQLPNLQQCIPRVPTPTVPPVNTPKVSPLPCPSVSAPHLPTPSPSSPCMPAPSLPAHPTPSPSISVCPSLSLPSLPIGAPDWISFLLGGG